MTQDQPLISLITTCKGRLTHLQQSLPRMVAQAGCEVIVVDYDCPDGTAPWVQANHGQVKVVRIEDAPSFSASRARNRGAEAARGQWLAFVDADVLLDLQFAARLVPQLTKGRYYRPRHRAPDLHGLVVCATSDFLDVGGYDEAIRGWGGEDRDLYVRLASFFGCKLVRFPGDWVGFIPHDDAQRVRFADVREKRLGQGINAFYRMIKYDLFRLSGDSRLALDLRQRLHEQVRRPVVDAARRGETTVSVTIDVSRVPGIALPPGHSATRRLRYEFGMPAFAQGGTPVDAAPVPVVAEVKPITVAAQTGQVQRASAGPLAEFQWRKRSALTDGPTLFAMVRNESYLLPHFLRHYRSLGVENFVFYDDHSTDGTLDLLAAQDGCTILTSERGYREVMPDGRSFQLHAKRSVPESLGTGRWVLTVDADEFLVLPQCFSTMAELQQYLDARRHRCVFASMVDFYPDRLADRNHPQGMSPFDGSPNFDLDRAFERSWNSPRPRSRFKGVRARLLAMLEQRDRDAFDRIVKERQYRMTSLWKVPLIKVGCGVTLEAVHEVNVQPPFDIEVALAHFKFGPDLDARIASALVSRSYFNASVEYEFLKAAVAALEFEPLVYPGSMRYAGPGSLQEAGFVFVSSQASQGTAARGGPERTGPA